MAIRIRFEHTRYPHLGEHSGFPQLIRYLDPNRYRSEVHGASDNDDDLPRYLWPMRPWLRRCVQRRGMAWYKLSDLTAEVRALPGCLTNRYDLIHFLDAEHSAQYLPRILKQLRASATRTIATFHQPPEVLEEVIRTNHLCWFDHVTLVAPSQLRFFRPHVAPDRLHLLLHGVDATFFHPRPRRNLTRSIRCITVGHWMRDWSAINQVVQALRDQHDIAFDVVTNRATDLDGLPNVTIHRDIGDAALAERYKSADVLFLPLIQSTANNTLLEGIASGLPVVVSDLEAVRAPMCPGLKGFLSLRIRCTNLSKH